MKKFLFVLTILAAGVIFYEMREVALTDQYIEEANNKNIEAIKAMTVNVPLFNLSGQVGEGIVKMTGIDGTVKWSIFKPEKYKDNTKISCVEAVVNCKDKKGKPHTAEFQFLINSETGYMELTSYT